MSTAAQITANQLNAQFSTGPRSVEGKSTVSQNATKHGLTATYPVIRTPAEQTQFDEMSTAFMEELRPYTPSEQSQFKQLILAAWNIDRCHRLESELADSIGIDPLLDDTASKTLARIETYRLRAERLFHRNLKELKAIPPNRYIPHNKPISTTPIQSSIVRSTPEVGRNQPCPCKSGKKYKFCCLNKGVVLRVL